MTAPGFLDKPPESEELTDYDRAHVKFYLRLVDAEAEGADWRDVVSTLFGLDPALEPDRVQRIYESHLARARWMTTRGYQRLLKHGP